MPGRLRSLRAVDDEVDRSLVTQRPLDRPAVGGGTSAPALAAVASNSRQAIEASVTASLCKGAPGPTERDGASYTKHPLPVKMIEGDTNRFARPLMR
jgi:hypothetical protein